MMDKAEIYSEEMIEARRKITKQKIATYSSNLKKLAKKIRQKQLQYEVSYGMLAIYAGLSRNCVREYLVGQTTPDLNTVVLIVRAMGEIEALCKHKVKKGICKN